MNDKKIITQKERNYIETLYLNFNLENASDTEDWGPSFSYYNVVSYMTDNMLPTGKYLSDADGRSWYQFENYRMGIMSYDKAKIANQFNCVIQYEQHHLWTLDKDLNGLDLPFDVDRKHYHIKRIDITKIAKHEPDYTINHGYLSPFKGHPLRPNRKEETVYLGNRKNGNVFRMYPKTLELLANKNYKKIALLSEYFGDIENLWTYELELQRKYLKGSLGIETLAQLDQVYSANSNIVGKIRFFKDTPKNKKLLEQNHRDRIKALVLTDFEEYERVEKKRYAPSFDYLIKRIVKESDAYLDSMEIERTNDEYMKIINAVISERIDTVQKDMVIDYVDTVYSDDMAQMTAKHILMRDNQTNELEIESKRHFGTLPIGKPALALAPQKEIYLQSEKSLFS